MRRLSLLLVTVIAAACSSSTADTLPVTVVQYTGQDAVIEDASCRDSDNGLIVSGTVRAPKPHPAWIEVRAGDGEHAVIENRAAHLEFDRTDTARFTTELDFRPNSTSRCFISVAAN